jgi:hypothetical protein
VCLVYPVGRRGEHVILEPGNGVGLNYVSYWNPNLNIEAYYIGISICVHMFETNVDLCAVFGRARL